MSMVPDAPGPRFQALLQLLSTAETLWDASRVFFARWDLSPSQFNVLYLLLDAPSGRTQTELSRRLLMHRSNVTGLVDRLEIRRLVKRLGDPKDRRSYRVVLTAGGRRLMDQILPHYYRAGEEAWGRFPAEQAQRLVADLQQVSRNAERMAAEYRF
jgi:MarR family 2-MHQ and catechol resistance regulon transcriptional repressor